MDDLLMTSWTRCWQALGATGDGLALMQQLIAAYQEPQRHYHTLQHLNECLDLLAGQMHVAEHPAEVEMALWFHDVVYDVHAKDNEAQSAAWVTTALQAEGVGEEIIRRIHGLIMVTCHSGQPETVDEQLLVDIDLAILGSEPQRFMEYSAQIRAEYAWVAEELYRSTRLGILKSFAARRPIYSTPALAELLERQAHDNLDSAIAQLAAGSV